MKSQTFSAYGFQPYGRLACAVWPYYLEQAGNTREKRAPDGFPFMFHYQPVSLFISSGLRSRWFTALGGVNDVRLPENW